MEGTAGSRGLTTSNLGEGGERLSGDIREDGRNLLKWGEGRARIGAVVEDQEDVAWIAREEPKGGDDLGIGIRIGGAEVGSGAQEGISRGSWRKDLVASLETMRHSRGES